MLAKFKKTIAKRLGVTVETITSRIERGEILQFEIQDMTNKSENKQNVKVYVDKQELYKYILKQEIIQMNKKT